MACRIDEVKIQNEDPNYLSFTQVRQQEVADYFIDWICVSRLDSSTIFTKALYDIINALPTPTNADTGQIYNIDDIRNMVYHNAKNNAQQNINLLSLSMQIYGDENTIINYAAENAISIDTEFRYNKRALRKFIQLHVNTDGINLTFSRSDLGRKIKTSDENPDVIIIESHEFANALRNELNENVK